MVEAAVKAIRNTWDDHGHDTVTLVGGVLTKISGRHGHPPTSTNRNPWLHTGEQVNPWHKLGGTGKGEYTPLTPVLFNGRPRAAGKVTSKPRTTGEVTGKPPTAAKVTGMKIHEKLSAIQAVAIAISGGDLAAASLILSQRYPVATAWEPSLRATGPKSPARSGGTRNVRRYTDTFIRDGFVDRYTGQRLIFPGALLLLSHLMPAAFPYNKNWRPDACHSAYWDFYPTIDHIDPGGVDAPSNWFSTTQNNNAAKGNRTLEQVGWPTFPPGNIGHWDGMLNWFVDYIESHPEALSNRKVSEWFRASTVHGRQ